MSERERIVETLKAHLPALRRDFSVSRVGLFGSVLAGTSKEGSDVDLLVEFLEKPGLLTFVKLRNHLSFLIGKDVDLVMASAIKPALREEILRNVQYVA